MSAPQTNIDKQKRRHRGPLVGMAVVVTFVGLLLFWWLGQEASQNDVNPGAQALPEGTPTDVAPAGETPTDQAPATY